MVRLDRLSKAQMIDDVVEVQVWGLLVQRSIMKVSICILVRFSRGKVKIPLNPINLRRSFDPAALIQMLVDLAYVALSFTLLDILPIKKSPAFLQIRRSYCITVLAAHLSLIHIYMNSSTCCGAWLFYQFRKKFGGFS